MIQTHVDKRSVSYRLALVAALLKDDPWAEAVARAIREGRYVPNDELTVH